MLRVDIALTLGDFALDLDFAVDHELLVLFGPSGSGKSLTLSALAGLRTPHRGHIEIAGRTVFDATAGINLPPQRRNVGYVVQQLALFPHLTVAANVAYGLGDLDRPARARRVEELLALLKLDGLDDRMPAQLSGGQQQRVALARALARPTDALLLDEPFSALDEALRADLRSELIRLRADLELPVVFVTHDLREAHLLGDRIAVLDRGRILQFGTRDEIYRAPASRRVAELTGIRNIFPARLEATEAATLHLDAAGLPLRAAKPAPAPNPTSEGSETNEVPAADAASAEVDVAIPAADAASSEMGAEDATSTELVDVAIRAELCNLRRFDPDEPLPENCFPARLVSNLAFGSIHLLTFEPEGPGPTIEVEIAARPYAILDVPSRDRWVVELPPEDLHVFPP